MRGRSGQAIELLRQTIAALTCRIKLYFFANRIRLTKVLSVFYVFKNFNSAAVLRVSFISANYECKDTQFVSAIPRPNQNPFNYVQAYRAGVYSLNCHFFTSNTPRVVSLSSGITGRLKNDRLMNGSTFL